MLFLASGGGLTLELLASHMFRISPSLMSAGAFRCCG